MAIEVMWTRLQAVVEEQAQVLIRTAFSPIVRECGDISAGIFDTSGRMLAQAVTGTPGHINTMAASVGLMLEHFRSCRCGPATAIELTHNGGTGARAGNVVDWGRASSWRAARGSPSRCSRRWSAPGIRPVAAMAAPTGGSAGSPFVWVRG